MTIKPIRLNLAERLKNKRFRERFVSTLARDEIASQIRELRIKRGFRTQSAFAKASGMQQSAASRIEQADYSGWSFRTLLRVALALNARLRVSFEPLEEVVAASEGSEAAAELQSRTISAVNVGRLPAFSEDATVMIGGIYEAVQDSPVTDVHTLQH